MWTGWCRGPPMPGPRNAKMADLINLRRVRKAKARAQKGKVAEANRVAHGFAKPLKKLAEARTEKEGRALSGHKLEPAKSDK
jgi:hypothetical protein